jgi:hypothetical protein
MLNLAPPMRLAMSFERMTMAGEMPLCLSPERPFVGLPLAAAALPPASARRL